MFFSSHLFGDLITEQKKNEGDEGNKELALVELRTDVASQKAAQSLLGYTMESFENVLGLVVNKQARKEVLGICVLSPGGKDPRGKLHGVISVFECKSKDSEQQQEDDCFLNLIETYGKEKKHFTYLLVEANEKNNHKQDFFQRHHYKESREFPSNILLSKRLIDGYAMEKPKNQQEMEKEIRTELSVFNNKQWKDLRFLSVPWVKQIGPSCGIAAMRMISYYFYNDDRGNKTSCIDSCGLILKEPAFSLLEKAKKWGYSKDGELYDLNHTLKLMKEIVPRAEIIPCTSISFETNLLYLFPYDKGPGSGLPEKKNGKTAHYCVLIGNVFSIQREEEYWIAIHGASKKICVASKTDWMESNQQLNERNDGTNNIYLKNYCIVLLP